MNSNGQEARSVIFARNVQRLRKERGWSQAELGRRLGGSHALRQARVAAIEATGSVTIDQADAFAGALGVPIEVLLYEHAPATEAMRIQQTQRLLRIAGAVGRLRDEVAELVGEIARDMPLPEGVTTITADSVIRKGGNPDGER
jgi:transcriptional regulator with XRE-family HTH domain